MSAEQFVRKVIQQFNNPLTPSEIKTLLESFSTIYENDENFSARDALLIAKLFLAKNSHDDIYKQFCEFRWRYIAIHIEWRTERDCVFCCDCGQDTWNLTSFLV